MSSRKRKTILTPQGPLWPAFFVHLTQRLLVETNSAAEPVCRHKRTMPATIQSLIAVGLAQRNVFATRELFRERGLCCDCEVWRHPEALVGEPPRVREAWEDENGNFDMDAFYWSEVRDYN